MERRDWQYVQNTVPLSVWRVLQGLPSIEVLTFKQVLKIEYEAVMAILNKSSSRMKYRRANLESLFKGLGLKVKFTTADMKETLKETVKAWTHQDYKTSTLAI